jgi:Tol biopolymer transport system component
MKRHRLVFFWFPVLFVLIYAISLLATHTIPASAQEGVIFEGQIAYLGKDNNIWILLGSGEYIQVTIDGGTGDFYYQSPAFSSDGSLLAFCRSDYSSNETITTIYIIDTATVTILQQIDEGYCGFDWSMDGSQIIFSKPFIFKLADGEIAWENARGLYIADINSAQASELIPRPGKNPLVSPNTSPDGEWVQFYEVIYIEGIGNFTTWEQASGTFYDFSGYGTASWSPDSSRIAFDDVTYVGFEGSGIFISSPDGSNLNKLYSDSASSASGPLWSPDGNLLAFMVTKPDDYDGGDLVLMTPEGELVKRTYLETTYLIAWSPIGRRLLYLNSTDQNFAIYDLDSGSSLDLPAGGYDANWAPRPGPDTFSIGGQILSVDGTPVSGVLVTGNGGITAQSDENGSYNLLDIPGGNCTLIPEQEGYSFDPPSQSVEVFDDLTGLNFTAVLQIQPEASQEIPLETQQVQTTLLPDPERSPTNFVAAEAPTERNVSTLQIVGFLMIAAGLAIFIVVIILVTIFLRRSR